MPELFTQRGIARFLGLSNRVAASVVRSGRVRAVHVPGLKHPRFLKSDVERLRDEALAGLNLDPGAGE
jgi:hypothetical protein